MTIVCAYLHEADGKIWLGSDLQVEWEGLALNQKRGKWLIGDKWCIGTSGNLRGANLIEQHLPRLDEEAEDIFQFVNLVRGIFDEAGFVVADKHAEFPIYANDLLVTDYRQLWLVSSELGILHLEDNFYAEGSGARVAKGAARALLQHDPDIAPKELLARVIDAANYYVENCGSGCWIEPISIRIKANAASGGQMNA